MNENTKINEKENAKTNEEENILWIDEDYQPLVSAQEAKEMTPIVADFMDSVGSANDDETIKIRLEQKMKEHLPEKTDEEIGEFAEDIIKTVKIQEEKRLSLENAVKNGTSRAEWLSGELTKATSNMSQQQAAAYCRNLDASIKNANEEMIRTITTKAGVINKNPNLDGFIAEQHHVDTFNLNAQAKGSHYHAEVLKPDGTRYSKNGVDIIIKDTDTGRVVKRYQCKYCKNSSETAKAFEQGNYHGQERLIPADQHISKKHSTSIEAPDGTKSEPLTKVDAKKKQEIFQDGKEPNYDWNKFNIADVARGIAKESIKAGCIGAGVAAGASVIENIVSEKEINPSKVAEAAICGGADASAKAALAGALKVGAEKGILKVIPKGTPAGTLAAVATVAVENVKIIYQVAKNKLTPLEGIDKMIDTTASTVVGIAGSVKGAAIGGAIGAVFGPAGAVVGGVAGGIVGGIAGSAVGKCLAEGVKAVGKAAVKTIDTVVTNARAVVEGTAKAVGSFFGKVGNFLFG